MKKIFGLLALLLIMACDDGEMTFNTFNFGTASVQACANDPGLLYKVNGTQALILDLNPAALLNIETTTPRIVTLNATNRLIYRNYSGSVAAASICSNLPPATPAVIEEWNALPGGTIRVLTTAVRNDENIITGYRHTITLAAITLINGDQTTIINETEYGAYSKPLGYTFDFLDEEEEINLNSCDINNLVFRVNGSEALLFNLNPAIFPTVENIGNPAMFNIADDPNIVEILFNRYTGSASTTMFCDETPPITPTVQTQWEAVSGTLQIDTTNDIAPAKRQVISLINAVFINDAGESFTIGTTDDPYRIGTYITN